MKERAGEEWLSFTKTLNGSKSALNGAKSSTCSSPPPCVCSFRIAKVCLTFFSQRRTLEAITKADADLVAGRTSQEAVHEAIEASKDVVVLTLDAKV